MRTLSIELRRGAAAVVLVVTIAFGLAVLFLDSSRWAGQWSGLAAVLRLSTAFLLPTAVVGGAWQAGRERRRRTGGLLASTSRPAGHRVLAQWAAVCAAALAGYLVVFATGAFLVAPIASYAGGEWPVTVLIGALTVAVGCAIGVLIGRRVAAAVAGPGTGLILLVLLAGGLVIAGPAPHGIRWLTPTAALPDGYAAGVGKNTTLVLWYACLGIALLVAAAGTRRWWLGLIPVALTVALTGPAIAGVPTVDPVAGTMVCSSGSPVACVTRPRAFLLGAVAAQAAPIAGRVASVSGMPPFTRVQELTANPTTKSGGPGVALVSLSGLATVDGSVANPASLRASIANALLSAGYCPDDTQPTDPTIAQESQWSVVREAVVGWMTGDPITATDSETARDYQGQLSRLPSSEQGTWVGRYLQLVKACDSPGLRELVTALP